MAGSPFRPASSLKLKSGGHAGQGWFRNGGARLEGPDTDPPNPKICVESVASLEGLCATSWRGC